MGRTHVNTTIQPDEVTCGPAAIKHALAIFGTKKSITLLSKLCKTSRHGTTTTNMIHAIRTLGFSVLSVEKVTLNHLSGALWYPPNQPRAVIVCYLYSSDNNDHPIASSGHWAAVSSYSASKSRIVIFDSYTGQKKSYSWGDFRKRWKDYDLKRKKISPRKYRYVRKWRRRLMLVVAKTPDNLPTFRIKTAATYTPLMPV